MKKKISLTLDNDFQQYCDLNNIENPEKLAKQVFNKGFSLLKYGETPNGFKSEPTVVEKEVIKEVIKEVEKIVEKIVKVPVEVIKEVIKEVPVEVIREVIKEVTVEVVREVPIEIKGDTQVITKEVIKEVKVEVPVEVIKEVKVEKIVEVIKEVINTEEIDKLTQENLKLTTELNLLKSSLDNLGKKGTLMRGSNMSSLYDE
jgi:hypothetical protein